jgi:hypothetical protein
MNDEKKYVSMTAGLFAWCGEDEVDVQLHFSNGEVLETVMYVHDPAELASGFERLADTIRTAQAVGLLDTEVE